MPIQLKAGDETLYGLRNGQYDQSGNYVGFNISGNTVVVSKESEAAMEAVRKNEDIGAYKILPLHFKMIYMALSLVGKMNLHDQNLESSYLEEYRQRRAKLEKEVLADIANLSPGEMRELQKVVFHRLVARATNPSYEEKDRLENSLMLRTQFQQIFSNNLSEGMAYFCQELEHAKFWSDSTDEKMQSVQAFTDLVNRYPEMKSHGCIVNGPKGSEMISIGKMVGFKPSAALDKSSLTIQKQNEAEFLGSSCTEAEIRKIVSEPLTTAKAMSRKIVHWFGLGQSQCRIFGLLEKLSGEKFRFKMNYSLPRPQKEIEFSSPEELVKALLEVQVTKPKSLPGRITDKPSDQKLLR